MGYIKDSLSGSEEITFKTRFHWLYSLAMWLSLMVLGPLLIGVVIFLRMFIRKLTTELGVTSQRVVFKTGWIARKTEEISLTNIEEMNLEQSIFGRLLGYGQLRIRGTGGSYILTHSIDDPMEFRQAVGEARSKVGR
ncbi:PH domain-containing protein [Kordiimonas aquimaris]|uniref:PH domain-containing protein n=1 Tax=Kordiimonas aquimaris TaxID=707591 RepID=UPI0021D17EEB|nr:PH domain-containing protein [Kordiimonas aquimaris]